MAVTVDRDELKALSHEPVDMTSHRGGLIFDEVVVDETFAQGLPRLEVLLGRVVLVLSELLLIRRACGLDDTAGQSSGTTRANAFLQYEYRGTRRGGLNGCRKTGAATAHDDHVCGLVPLASVGGGL